MKAVVYEKYGSADVLEYKEIERPVPKEDEVLIKVIAASVNAFDWHVMRADPFFIRLMGFGFWKPKSKTPGADVSGVIEAVGEKVKQFKPGDKVFGCGRGSFAEYACVKESRVALKPDSIAYSDAAALPMAALTALQGLRDKGMIQTGQKVLIDGASGGVGTFALQIAKALGAEVTAVCSTSKIEIARSIGADHVIDYTVEDFVKNGIQYDLIFVANGNRTISDYKRALKPDGVCVMAGGGGSVFEMLRDTLHSLWISKTTGKKMLSYMANINQKDLDSIKDFVETGKVKPVIDRIYKLDEITESIRYVEKGHARGKVIIAVEGTTPA